MGGHLDHIFQPHAEGIIMNSCRLLTYMTNGEVARPDQLCFNKSDTAPRFPSDHMPMKAEFTLPVFQ